MKEDKPIAFPGAEGFGRFTTGGRGGRVLVVDNLLDSVKNPPKGSLRWALKQKGPRIIVFSVSGNIELEGALEIKNGDLTIAGQTAPGDGICLKNFATEIRASNVIIRYLRFRCGNEKLTSSEQDALNCMRQSNVIIDHCSMSWSIDETGTFYDNKNFTLQWSIISESLYAAGHQKGEHGFGGIWGGMGATFHHNLLSSHTSRNPRFNGSRFSRDSVNEIVDFRNNVVFNWGFNSAYGGEEGKQNIVNNYYKPGPATREGELKYRILDLTQVFFIKEINPDTLYAGKFFVDGNVVEGNEKATKDNWGLGVQRATAEQKKKSRSATPFVCEPVATETAEQAYKAVIKDAGAILPARDEVDKRIIDELITGICKYGGKFGTSSGIIDSQASIGGWPQLKTYNVPVDTDQDGMPDKWEKEKGLDPSNPADATLVKHHSYYTNIEVYINSISK
jgi:pectate lyase